MLLRHWQTVVRGFNTVDHVLRRHQIDAGLEAGRAEPDSLLNGKEALSSDAELVRFLPLRQVAIIVLVCGPIYGAAMGSYALAIGRAEFY